MSDIAAVNASHVFAFGQDAIDIMTQVLDLMQFRNTHGRWPALSMPDAEDVPPPPAWGKLTGLANARSKPISSQDTFIAPFKPDTTPPLEIVGEKDGYYRCIVYLWKARMKAIE